MRGFGTVGILAFLVILVSNGFIAPFRAVPVILWVWRSGTPWREIGYVRPKSWIGGLLIGVVFGVAFKPTRLAQDETGSPTGCISLRHP
ncbi:MAG: hypothetical protein ACRD3J_00835 [Thermoanaerobaculia bacterium]